MATTKKTWVLRGLAILAIFLLSLLCMQDWSISSPSSAAPTRLEERAFDNGSTVDLAPRAGRLAKRWYDMIITPWATAVSVGEWFVCMMNAPEGTITQSTWTNYGSLQIYGWDVSTDPVTGYYDMRNVWQALGISTNYADWTEVLATHGRTTTHTLNGQTITYPLTEGRYQNIYNLRDGVILALSNFGPEYENKAQGHNVPPAQMVPLRSLSDVWGLIWDNLHAQSQTYTDAKQLHHMFQYCIENPGTEARIIEVMARQDPPLDGKIPGQLPRWPGLQFSIRDPEAKALMNTSNSAGVAWLLGQHKEQLGVRIVDQVNVFSTRHSGDTYWNMYYHVRTGPLPQGQLR